MRLTLQTDFALRVLLYLAVRRDQWVASHTMAGRYGVSANHMSKVAKDLVTRGLLEARRGHAGGFRLAVEPRDLRLGALVAQLEPTMDLLDCFGGAPSACILSPGCGLRTALMAGQRAFVETLDAWTLADVAKDRRLVDALFGADAPSA